MQPHLSSSPHGLIGARFGRHDIVAVLLVLGLVVFLAKAGSGLAAPLASLDDVPVTLDRANLVEYAMRTTLRMIAAMALSLLFTLTYATLAAKSRRAERVLIPILDILQSVPILGFISVTVVFFMSLAPGRVLGAEFAAIFAIFTSQAWNMAFSFYQSLRTVPVDLVEASRSLRLSPWMRFWRLEVPFATPALIWNMMMSMSGGWFFVVAAEAISVGKTTVTLPGVGSYIALAIERRDVGAILWAIGAMAAVILSYDQLLFRPLVAWADRFRAEQQSALEPPRSWVLDALRGSQIISYLMDRAHNASRLLSQALSLDRPAGMAGLPDPGIWAERAWMAAVATACGYCAWTIYSFLAPTLATSDLLLTVGLAVLTLLRVVVLLVLASVIWVPIGILVGLRPRVTRVVQPLAQFMAAFPANLFFPLVVYLIVRFRLSPDIWLSPLMILGTQWYILFNVIAGASAMPSEFRDVGSNLGVSGLLWWKRIALPSVFPFYLTGAITAAGGSINASIVAETVSWGEEHFAAHGIGAYIAEATVNGDYPKIVLGITVMSAFVVLLNRTVWRPLYAYAERRLRLD